MDVKLRKYASPLRTSQALATRSRVLEEARRLFSVKGYGGVKLSDVAREANVSLPALYKTFGSKLELFAAAVMTAIANDLVDRPVVAQLWFREQLEAGDAREQLRLIARNARDVAERSANLLSVLRSAAAEESGLRELLARVDRERVERSTLTARSLASKARLLMPEAQAALTLSALTSPELYAWMAQVHDMGLDDYQEWCATMLVSALLGRDVES